MSQAFDSHRIENLRSLVDVRVRKDGYDHTLHFAKEWAEEESVDWDDLLDVLEANGCFCDCELVLK